MLDEFLEYKQYSYEIALAEKTEFNPTRLSARLLEHDRSGLPRALEIVARYHLFHTDLYDPTSVKDPAEDLAPVVRALQDWITKWVVSYLGVLYPDPEDPKKAKVKKSVEIANGRWSGQSLYSKKTEEGKGNSFNGVTYKTILAAAMNKGPLHRYILVEKAGSSEKIHLISKDGEEKKLSAKQTDYLLKLTAYFLLENRLNQKSVLLTNADLVNWWVNNTPNENRFFREDGIELFEKTDPSGTDNFIKYKADGDWISGYTLKDVTDAGDFEAWKQDAKNRGTVYYVDKGSGKLLERHVVGETAAPAPRRS